MPSMALVGAQFSKKTTVATASPQNITGMFRLFSRLCAMVTTVWFLRSMTPFCCSVYGAVFCLSTPCSVQYSSNATEVNSPRCQCAEHADAGLSPPPPTPGIS
jgi:hypothetical protein